MKLTMNATLAALLASTTVASAGGISRTDQSVDLLFEDGNVAQIGFGYVMPNVSDDATNSEMAPDYLSMSGGVKMDYGSYSAAILFDQPFGALVDYPIGSPYPTMSADLRVNNLTALVSYDVNENIVVYGGLAAQMTSADANIIPAPGAIDVSSSTGFGYVVGAAYQIPEYALRVSLTYRSAITSTHATTYEGSTVPDTEFTTPQSINLEAQTGINQKTLVFGSLRWVNYDAITITASSGPFAAELVDYTNDVFQYELGVGRKFTDTLSGALTVAYEASDGAPVSPLSPTDGRTSLGAALIYTMGATEVTGGVRYVWLGDGISTPASGSQPFSNNTALAVGVSIKHTF